MCCKPCPVFSVIVVTGLPKDKLIGYSDGIAFVGVVEPSTIFKLRCMAKNDLGDFSQNSFQATKKEIVMCNQYHPDSKGLQTF